MTSFENQGYGRLPAVEGEEAWDKSDDSAPLYTEHASGSQAPPPAQPYYDDPNRAAQPWGQAQQHVLVVPGQQTMGMAVQSRPTDWTIPAILACIFCFWPTGIFAIVFANKANTSYGQHDYEGKGNRRTAKIPTLTTIIKILANTSYGQHDYEGARGNARTAKILTLTSIGIGVVQIIATIILVVVLMGQVNEIVNKIAQMTTTTTASPYYG